MLHDKSNMGPNRLKVEYMAYLNNNLLFLLADVLECQLMECEKTNLDADYDRWELLGMSYTELLTIFETEFLES